MTTERVERARLALISSKRWLEYWASGCAWSLEFDPMTGLVEIKAVKDDTTAVCAFTLETCKDHMALKEIAKKMEEELDVHRAAHNQV